MINVKNVTVNLYELNSFNKDTRQVNKHGIYTDFENMQKKCKKLNLKKDKLYYFLVNVTNEVQND